MISSQEKRWACWFAIAVMLATTIPYFLAYSHSGGNWSFNGFVFGMEDGNSYIAKMMSGSAGAWLFRTPYTSYFQAGFLAFIPYLLLGKLASPPAQHIQLIAIYHIFRVLAGGSLIIITYSFVSMFVAKVQLRRLATVLATIGGGLGWLLIIIGRENWLGSLPLEFYSPERFGFLEIYGLPHLALARACMLMGLITYLRNKRIYGGFLLGMWIFLASICQPLTALSGILIVTSHLIYQAIQIRWNSCHNPIPLNRWKNWKDLFRNWMIGSAIGSPLILQMLVVSLFDPFMKQWNIQSIVLSPHPLQYLAAYGLVLPFAYIGLMRLIQTDSENISLLLGWLIIFPILAYLPYNAQRRLPEGVWVPLAILAVGGLEALFEKKPQIPKYAYIAATPLLISTLLIWIGGINSVLNPGLPLYRSRAEVDAFNYFRDQTVSTPVVLSSYETGNVLPAYEPVRVVMGLGTESINFDKVQPAVNSFYKGEMDLFEQEEFLREMNVSYIYWGPSEKLLGQRLPEASHIGELVYDKDSVQIYRVIHQDEIP